MKYLGIDYGTKRIGVAVSDDTATLAFPLTVLESSSRIVEDLSDLAKKEGANHFILGESRNYSGEPNPLLKETDVLKKLLTERGFLVTYEPEFMSSQQASRGVVSVRLRSKNVLHKHIDSSAAAIILQTFLDRKSRQ